MAAQGRTDRRLRKFIEAVTNRPVLNHRGITNFVRLSEKPRAARRRAR